MGAALFHHHEAGDAGQLSDVTDVARSAEGALLFDRLQSTSDAVYLGAENAFERVELQGEPTGQPIRRLEWEFWDGEGWGPLVVTGNGDESAGNVRRTAFSWMPPSNWQSLSEGAEELPTVAPQYWIRVRLGQVGGSVAPRQRARTPLFAVVTAALVAAVVLLVVNRRRGRSRRLLPR